MKHLRLNRNLVVLILLIGLLVSPVLAATLSFSNITHNYYLYNTTNDTFFNLRNSNGKAVLDPAPTALYALVTANSTTPYLSDYRFAVITINSSALGSGSVATAGTITGYTGTRTGSLGNMNATWIDITPQNGGGIGVSTDFNKTTYTEVTNELPYTSFGTLNASVTWTLNAAGLARINPTGNTTFALVSNWTVENIANTPAWSSGAESRISIRSMGYAGGAFTPYVNLTYNSGAPPVTNFGSNVTSGTVPFGVAFTDSTVTSPTAWSWNFGDSGTSILQNPTHTYTSAGNYTVSLTATNSTGTSTTTKTNYISATGAASTSTFYAVYDGHTKRDSSLGESFSQSRTQTGTSMSSSTNAGIGFVTNNVSGNYILSERSGFTFDTSSIPTSATITAATVYLYGNTGGADSESAVMVDFNPTNSRAYAITDHDLSHWGTTPIAPNLSHISESTTGYNAFSLSDLTQITKGGDTVIGLRAARDIDNIEPAWASNQYFTMYFAAIAAGTGKVPYMDVSYTVPPNASTPLHIYPITQINSTMYLPNVDTNLPAEGTTLSIAAAQDQYEPASFIIKSPTDTSGLNVTVSELNDGLGNVIPSTAIDVRAVKAWYQAGPRDDPSLWVSTALPTPSQSKLYPELLLKDDSLVVVNTTTMRQWLRVHNNTFTGYVPIDNTNWGWSTDWQVFDNATATNQMQPINLPANQNKQIWLTTHVPSTTPGGTYTGTITITSSTSESSVITFTVTVYGYQLRPSSKTYGLYQWGRVAEGTVAQPYNLGRYPFYKTKAQFAADLESMKEHGIQYVELAGYRSSQMDETLKIMNASGMAQDNIYAGEESLIPYDPDLRLASSPADIASLTSATLWMKNITTTYGYTTLWAKGYEEASRTNLPLQRTALSTVRAQGVKTYQANRGAYPTAAAQNADLLDRVDISGNALGVYNNAYFSQSIIAAYTANNSAIKIYVYANPQLGLEDYSVYRKAYGYNMYVVPHLSGMFDYAWQDNTQSVNVWNDFSQNFGTGGYRATLTAYPSSTGPIPTIEYEGLRQAITDNRYADTLSFYAGTNTTTLSIINAGLAAGSDPSVIRASLANAIIPAEGGTAPVAHFYMNITSSGEYSGYGAGTTYAGTAIGGGSDYSAKVTTGTYIATSTTAFLANISNATSGQTIFIPTGTTIDLTGLAPVTVPAGVTIASDRGTSGHAGGILTKTRPHTVGAWEEPMLQIGGNNVRITGLQTVGEQYAQDTWGTYPLTTCLPSDGSCANEASFLIGIKNGASGSGAGYTGLVIDNNEMKGWAYAAIFTNSVPTVGRPYIHHNYIHDNNNRGEGYGVNIRGGDVLVVGNLFDYNRHSITGEGLDNEKYTFQYNLLGGHGSGIGMVDCDVHRNEDTGVNAGLEYHIDHNTVTSAGVNGFSNTREVPITGVYLTYNDINSDGGTNDGFTQPITQFATSVSSISHIYATNNRWKGIVYATNTGITEFFHSTG